MGNSENSSDQPEPNTIRIGVENISDGDINIEVTEKITPNNGEDILIGVDNHSVSGNNNIKVYDIDFTGCGSARIGAGNFAGGCNYIFIGGLQPTNESTPSPASPPRLPNRPAGFPGPLLSALPNVTAAAIGPSLRIESDDVNSGSSTLPGQSPEIQIGNRNRIARVTSRKTPQPPSRSKTISRGPVQPLPPNGPLPPKPPTKPF